MILPFQTLKFTTRLQADEVAQKMRDYVGQPPKWFKRPPEPYVGMVEDNGFRIYRNIKGRNSFLPILSGRITAGLEGTQVAVRFGVHWAVVAFSLLWLAIVMSSPNSFRIPAVIFLLVLVGIGYFPESSRAERDLKTFVPPIPEVELKLVGRTSNFK